MKSTDIVKQAYDSAHYVLNLYLSDISDAELVIKPVPHANHIAWQLGHLICSEGDMINTYKPGSSIELPVNFKERHSRETAHEEWSEPFFTKQEYLALYDKQRAKTLEVIASLKDEDLSHPAPEKFKSFAPTVGTLLVMFATHEVMHAGQFVVVRRKLDKPIVM